MRKKNFFSALFILFLLVSASITCAQKISSQKGLTTAIFSNTAGIIRIYLPENIQPGDMISGRIIPEPNGKNGKQVEKNLDALKGYTISFNNDKFPVENAKKIFKVSIPGDFGTTGMNISLLNSSGMKVSELKVFPLNKKIQMPGLNNCDIPTHALCGSPLRITGPFDGDMSTTQCSLDGKPLEILAESPRQSIVSIPADAGGMRSFNEQENGKTVCSKQISGVEMNVTAGDLNLRKGQKTFIDVTITGLQNLKDTAFLSLKNVTTEVVVMLPSNNIIIPFFPDSIGNGNFQKRFDIQSIKTGSFTVNVNLDLPETETTDNPTTTEEQSGKCECKPGCSIKKVETRGDEVDYTADIIAECKGATGRGSTKVQCSVVSVTTEWSIGISGKDVAAIKGKADGKTVTVKLKTPGAYNLYCKVVVTCSDGSVCESVCSYEESYIPPPPTTTECGLSYEWCKGPSIKVKSYGFYPDNDAKDVLNDFRPGDLIGISAFATDFDYLMQRCLCPEGLEFKKHPINPDEVFYDWELKSIGRGGHGSLITDPDPASNSVIYQLPFCYEDYPLLDKVILTIYNKGKKAKDEQVQIEFTISITIKPPYYKEKVKKTYGLAINLRKEIINKPEDTDCKEVLGGDCVVQPWVWDKGSPLSYSSTITLKTSPDAPPDNLVLLHTSTTDLDNLTLKCFHKKSGLVITEKLLDVVDPTDITWDIIKGAGSFPLGKKGNSVVFVHNYNPANKDGSSANEVVIKCTISDSKMQALDVVPDIEIDKTIKPRIQPAAFVGVGDIHFLGSTEHGELIEAGERAVKNYEGAGYNVFTDFECKKPSIERVYKNNACQAVLMIGHSDATGVALSGGLNFFVPIDIRTWVNEKWGCFPDQKHPIGRELILMGCNVGEGEAEWYKQYFRLEKFYGRKEWVWSSAAFSSILKYIKEEHKPLPPRIQDK